MVIRATWLMLSGLAACSWTHDSTAGMFVTELAVRGERLEVTSCDVGLRVTHDQIGLRPGEEIVSEAETTSGCHMASLDLPPGIHPVLREVPFHCRAQLARWQRAVAGDPRAACLARRAELGRLAQASTDVDERLRRIREMPVCGEPRGGRPSLAPECRVFAAAGAP